VGKQDELLRRLDELPGVDICEDTAVSSAGMLGWIATEGKEMREALGRAERMSEEMLERIKKRVIVFSTGWEVASGQIEDTNTQAIAAMLGAEGYTVNGGGVLPDEKSVIAGRMRLAIIDDGFGLVITTGGVGAEDKDHTVEAVLSLDPEAATPYICRHEVGSGRHVKDGVRVAVGQYRDALIVALPGPNDEVVLSLEILAEGLKSGVGKPALAESIARKLRERLRIISGRNASHGH
jgi:molybdenum cofactor synthesis domain-containing protein